MHAEKIGENAEKCRENEEKSHALAEKCRENGFPPRQMRRKRIINYKKIHIMGIVKFVFKKNGFLLGKAAEAVYPQALTYETIDTKRFAENVADRRRLELGHVRAVLAGIREEIAMCLSNGHSVSIEGLGTFSLVMRGEAVQQENGTYRLKDGYVSGVRFSLSRDLLADLYDVKFEPVDGIVRESAQMEDADALAFAAELTNRYGGFTRRDFARRVHHSYGYTKKKLDALVEAGSLTSFRVGQTWYYQTAG